MKIKKLLLVLVSLFLLTGCTADGEITQRSLLDWLGFTYDVNEPIKGTIEITPIERGK